MSLWTRLFRLRSRSAVEQPLEQEEPAEPAPAARDTVELPVEPFVFECRSCGKVFEARRKRPQCSECDSPDVSLMSG